MGSGLYGAVFAHEAKVYGKSVLVVDERSNIAGNVYTENIEGINVHKYGAHIFHTNNKKVWNYITKFAEVNCFTNSPVVNYKGKLYSLPFNMYTFNKMWGVVTPEEATAKIDEQRKEIMGEPKNLEEQAISLVGRDIYENLIKGYTEKQWGRDCKDLPAFIIKRLPVHLTFDNNYFNALYQGIPIGGYTKMIANLLDGIEVRRNIDYLENKAELDALAEKVVYTGSIDAYFGYKLARWNIDPSVLRMNYWTSPISRGMQQLITLIVRYRGLESLSINVSSSTKMIMATICPRQLSAVNIAVSGSWEMNSIILSMMKKRKKLCGIQEAGQCGRKGDFRRLSW